MSATRSRTSLNCCTGSRPSVPPANRRTTAAPPRDAFTSLTHGPSTSWFSAPGGGGKLANFNSTCADAVPGTSSAAASSHAVHRRFVTRFLLQEKSRHSVLQNAFSSTVMGRTVEVKTERGGEHERRTPFDPARARRLRRWRGGRGMRLFTAARAAAFCPGAWRVARRLVLGKDHPAAARAGA